MSEIDEIIRLDKDRKKSGYEGQCAHAEIYNKYCHVNHVVEQAKTIDRLQAELEQAQRLLGRAKWFLDVEADTQSRFGGEAWKLFDDIGENIQIISPQEPSDESV